MMKPPRPGFLSVDLQGKIRFSINGQKIAKKNSEKSR